MKLYEYQAKQLLHARRIAVPPGRVTDSAERAGEIFVELGGKPVAVKAQVHAGGRGKGGGIKIAKTEKECQSIAESMLGSNLVTPQTGKAGLRVREAWIEPAAAIRSEYYAGIALDRDARKLVFMVCSEGGVEIEQVAYRSPEKIFKEHIDTALGLQVFQARRLAFKLGLKDNVHQQAVQLFLNLYKTFVSLDCSLLEINPLVVTQDERLLALDVKMNIDDNALYRQTQLTEAYDPALDLAPLERKAYEFNLNYVKLDGHVGCMVNGAGLAMATMESDQTGGRFACQFSRCRRRRFGENHRKRIPHPVIRFQC
ncbi:MAG: ATP-grasp domain-containing protein [candidate division KSB1 bacterium]|nr:ATP-grasp domain-containing protein [candidate division KSB1 bacterium]